MSSYSDLTSLFKSLSLPSDTPSKQSSSFTLCKDNDSVRTAIDTLSSYSTIVLDCEGSSLGNQGGRLSLVCLRTIPTVSSGPNSTARTFVFDAVSLSKEELQPLLDDVIGSDAIQKVVFDGRMDYSAFFFEYDTRIRNILDLQLADLQSRTLRGESKMSQTNRLTGYLLRSEVNAGRHVRYGHVQMIGGISRCLKDHNLLVQDKAHLDHLRWLERPLPTHYLSYAAHDVYIISVIYEHFLKRGYLNNSDTLAAQSTRYASIWENDQPREEDIYRRNPLLPLEILSVPTGTGATDRICDGCNRKLTRSSFQGINGTKCWVCMTVDVSENSKEERARFRGGNRRRN
ncbi:hypothetical protein K435DRAFT_727495 [Dendrothele bispora CBS 962.96]|uniref:3'-5' exonuclease domain-containing protein n=1 Tax=Dendrothele bispora (strain CBS 962.96) TaxID=1314807 RepID=A0A4S8LPR9_DENBC|nr:hypothetical protein K435DRAFT_727495 [Dendrothele bispora CBS 962.96]